MKLLFPYTNLPSFIRADVEFLEQEHELRLIPCHRIWQIVASIVQVWRCDALYLWFGSTRYFPMACMARLLGKPIVIVSGGYDVACVHEIQYGNMRGGLARFLGRWLFALANKVVCFSKSGVTDAIEHAKVDPAKIEMIYLGVPSGRVDAARPAKEKLAISVGFINASSIHRKGFLSFARASKLVPEIRFVLIGSVDDRVRQTLLDAAGPNFSIVGHVPADDLADYYHRAKVYLQPSAHEGFGLSVAEAMLYECVPIVSNVGSLPEVVGETGHYVDPRDIEGIAQAVREAIQRGDGRMARERIERCFSVADRHKQLRALLATLQPVSHRRVTEKPLSKAA